MQKQTMSQVTKDIGSNRFCVFPISYKNLWDYYKTHVSTFWTVEEVSLTDDLHHWNNLLNDNERFFIKNILAFFANSDGIVNENLVVKFYNEVTIPEARQFYSFQIAIEAIHNEMYSLILDTYITDSAEKTTLFNAIENIPAISKKADWALKWSNDTSSFSQRLCAFICVEGIFFSGSFCAIYWLKNKGLMPGLATANEFISRDEALHTEFAIELYKTHNDLLDESVVHGIFKEAVDIEKEFIIESLPVSLLGMNKTLMGNYIEFIADRWLTMIGYSKLYNADNPFHFMDMISLNTKENFFETRVSQYQRAHLNERELTFDEDF
jgi:ribonucleotide reductase beta subunit family protein with ferritin-like domain